MNTPQKTFSWTRVGSLLRYDWAIDKNRYRTTLIIITAIYAVLVLMRMMQSADSPLNILITPGRKSEAMDEITIRMIGAYIQSFFSYAMYAMIIVATVTLHRKFTNPQTSTSYLALPGSRAEKATAQCLHYALAVAATWALYLVMFYVTMLMAQLRFPEQSWLTINPISPMGIDDLVREFISQSNADSQDVLTHLTHIQLPSLLHAYLWTVPFHCILGIALYAVLNMLFRHNGQLKVIALFVIAYFVLLFLFITSIATGAMLLQSYAQLQQLPIDEVIINAASTVVTILKVILYLTPVFAAGLIALFYRQVARKQAK